MNEEYKKLVKKFNKVYVIELFVIAAVVITLATLKLLNIIGTSSGFRRVFNIITLIAATLLIADFVWLCFSKKRQKRNSWFDKISVLPVAIAMIVFDILGFINWNEETLEYSSIYIAIVFYYIGVIYIIQGIYHIYKPNPSIVAAAIDEYNQQLELAKKAAEELAKQADEKPQEENKE